MLNSICGQQGLSADFQAGERGSPGHSWGTLAGWHECSAGGVSLAQSAQTDWFLKVLKAANFPLTKPFWYSLAGPTITWECRLLKLRHVVSEKQKAFFVHCSQVLLQPFKWMNSYTDKVGCSVYFFPLFSCVLTYSLQSQWKRNQASH